jgi:hypothetical protein
MIDYEFALLDIDEMWEKSAECRCMTIGATDYDYQMVKYKARRLNDVYCSEYAKRYLNEHKWAGVEPESLDHCQREGDSPQCSFFCRNYSIEKGCILNAAE